MFYLVYTKKLLEHFGFYNNEDVLKTVLSENEDTAYFTVSDEVHDVILNEYAGASGIKLKDVEMPTEINDINDIDKYIVTPVRQVASIERQKKLFITRLGRKCAEMITAGTSVELSTGESKYFTFEIVDQINLEAIVNNKADGDTILYHAKGDVSDIEYSYADVKRIYYALYNNKIYNLAYKAVAAKWINENLTQEMLDGGMIIEYGFSNDEIEAEVERIYESQRLF